MIFLSLGLLTLAVRFSDLRMPLERDEGEYAYGAQEIARGYMPYKDTFCQKPPGIFAWYRLGFRLFGESVVGIHLTLALAAWLSGSFSSWRPARQRRGRLSQPQVA